MLGSLIDKTTDLCDITAQIISLASRGYIAMTRIEEKQLLVFNKIDYSFEIIKDTNDITFYGDKKVLGILFGYLNPQVGTKVLMSDLKNDSLRIQSLINQVEDGIKTILIQDGYLEPGNKNLLVKLIGILFLFVSGFIIQVFSPIVGSFIFILVPAGIICGLMLLGIRSKYTQLGVDTQKEVLGFKEFLSVTDKERFDFHNAPEKTLHNLWNFYPTLLHLE
jgi:hypothetical protein